MRKLDKEMEEKGEGGDGRQKWNYPRSKGPNYRFEGSKIRGRSAEKHLVREYRKGGRGEASHRDVRVN